MSDTEKVRIICATSAMKSHFDDDVIGPCALCGVELRWRPHVQEPSEKVCIPCFKREARAGQQIEVSPSTISEVLKLFNEGKFR